MVCAYEKGVFFKINIHWLVVTCSVTASDGQRVIRIPRGRGREHAPTVSNAYLSPTQPYTNDVLTAYATGDTDVGQTLSLHYTWYVNNIVLRVVMD